MSRSFLLQLVLAAVVFWVLTTMFSEQGLSVDGFKGTFVGVVVFSVVYCVIQLIKLKLKERKS